METSSQSFSSEYPWPSSGQTFLAMDMAEGNVEIVHHGTDMARKGKGKGRVMDMGGGLYMREGSNIYNSTVANRAMLIQTQFYDGRRYCKGHGKGDLLNHDLCELAGTPVVMHRDERLVAERAARKAAEKADRERKAAEKAAQEAAEKAAREAAAKAHREAASSSTGLVDGWRDPAWVQIQNELEQKASQPGAAEEKPMGHMD